MILCPWKEIDRYASVIPGLVEAAQVVNNLKSLEPATYPLSCGKVMVQKGTTHALEGAKLEAHRKFLDIQYVLEGKEVCGWAPTDSVEMVGEFNEEKDCGLYLGKSTPITMEAGMCYILYPEDAHAPCCHLDTPNDYRKIVVKLAL